MNTKYRIDPSHIWDIEDENLDASAIALLARLVGLQHLSCIRMSNGTLAKNLRLSKHTISNKMKLLAKLSYIYTRSTTHEETRTKITVLNKDFIVDKICASVKGSRQESLMEYYRACRENESNSHPTGQCSPGHELDDEEKLRSDLQNLLA